MKKIVILLGFASLLLACKEQRLYKDGKNNGEEYCNCMIFHVGWLGNKFKTVVKKIHVKKVVFLAVYLTTLIELSARNANVFVFCLF